jgi:hypothetical protein
MSKKLTLEYVKGFFEEQGCKLLEKRYKNNKTKMSYRCNCGNISKIQFGNFKHGQRCFECGHRNKGEKKRLSFKYIKSYFEKNGCELLENKYINSRTKMRYQCSCGNISKIAFKHCYNFIRCKECGEKACFGENHYRWIKDRKKYKERKKFRQKCYSMLRKTLKETYQKKENRTYKMLGYTAEELQDYICNHSNWEEVKNLKWHLDHIYPIGAFLDYGINDVKLINCLENLQPLECRENISKSDKYDQYQFEDWLIERNYEIRK